MDKQTTSDIAKRYRAIKIRFSFAKIAINISYFVIFQFSGLSHIITAYISKFFNSQGLIIGGYLFIFGAIYCLIILPLDFYNEFLLERKYRLLTQTFLSWLSDKVKVLIISAIIFFIFFELFYFLLRKSDLFWWLWMTLIWFLFSIFFTQIFPILIIPLFFKYKTIDNINLQQAITDLAKGAKLEVLGVFQIDFSKKTTKVNAALVGLGKSKRIILADNLLSHFTDQEIMAVVAHELGHYKYLHMWRIIFFNALSALIGFYLIFALSNRIIHLLGLSSLSDIKMFPMIGLILTILGLIYTVVYNNYSRSLEKQADAFALTEMKNKEAFISCMTKLGEQNLSDFSPNKLVEFFFYDHPPISKRISFAERNCI
ncbi:MAG: M48 family metallopeptidase [Candidatus Omnitrophica bacterium]|nr:M48 family metallopeptidase [Candidatus Omnitrophota bacterium]